MWQAQAHQFLSFQLVFQLRRGQTQDSGLTRRREMVVLAL